jgi:hypothetical protein
MDGPRGGMPISTESLKPCRPGRNDIAASGCRCRRHTRIVYRGGPDGLRENGGGSPHPRGALAYWKAAPRTGFTMRSRCPPHDRISCLLSFQYALVRHDCVAALTAAGLDPFVGFLHADRPNRPSLALDLMEEFRPWLSDRLVVTLVNRQQISLGNFVGRAGGTDGNIVKNNQSPITNGKCRRSRGGQIS